MVSAWLASHTLEEISLLGLIAIGVTLVFGRVFCGWFCPFGTLHNAVASLRRQLRRVVPRVEGFSRWQLHLDPAWDFFRDDPRFNDLVRPEGVPPGVTVHITGNVEANRLKLAADRPPNVTFTGFLPEADFVQLLATSAVIVCAPLVRR